MITEQLGHQLGIRRFTTAAAGTGKLQQRTVELRLSGQIVGEPQVFIGKMLESIIVNLLLLGFFFIGHHVEGFVLGRAHIGAGTTTGAVYRRNGNGKLILIHALSNHRCCLGLFGSAGKLLSTDGIRTEHTMRAHHHAAVALDAVTGHPSGDVYRNTTALKLGRTLRQGSRQGRLLS